MAMVWANPAAIAAYKDKVNVIKGAASTGTEANALGAADGLDLRNFDAVEVAVEAGGAMTAGNLQAYVMNPATGQWNRAPGLDLAVAAANSQAYPAVQLQGLQGRLAYLPNGLGIASNVYMGGIPRRALIGF